MSGSRPRNEQISDLETGHGQTAEADRITSDGDIICEQSAFNPRTVTVFQEKWCAEIVLRGAFRGVIQCMSFASTIANSTGEKKLTAPRIEVHYAFRARSKMLRRK
jgi:hypothetical protein